MRVKTGDDDRGLGVFWAHRFFRITQQLLDENNGGRREKKRVGWLPREEKDPRLLGGRYNVKEKYYEIFCILRRRGVGAQRAWLHSVGGLLGLSSISLSFLLSGSRLRKGINMLEGDLSHQRICKARLRDENYPPPHLFLFSPEKPTLSLHRSLSISLPTSIRAQLSPNLRERSWREIKG